MPTAVASIAQRYVPVLNRPLKRERHGGKKFARAQFCDRIGGAKDGHRLIFALVCAPKVVEIEAQLILLCLIRDIGGRIEREFLRVVSRMAAVALHARHKLAWSKEEVECVEEIAVNRGTADGVLPAETKRGFFH